MSEDSLRHRTADHIAKRILVVRGQRVVINTDLALLYGVTTKRLNEQIKRNKRRFPDDFVFRLTPAERDEVVANCDHLSKLRFSPSLPYALTEHGAIMAASVLNTSRAIQVSVFVVRAFVRLRDALTTHKELARRLNELEKKAESITLKHDAFSAETRTRFRELIEALRQLMAAPERKARPIGFVTDLGTKGR
ncbi:MAG TPA: ORF6N domain-containing protein [Burkholderiales bacterium]|nr:ORF6N domain-containing protein [Burkholderiales bacterium]